MAVLGIVIILAAVVLTAVFLGPTARNLGAQTRERRSRAQDEETG
jgi:hypothetical protein